jgi:hypothetical protein
LGGTATGKESRDEGNSKKARHNFRSSHTNVQ